MTDPVPPAYPPYVYPAPAGSPYLAPGAPPAYGGPLAPVSLPTPSPVLGFVALGAGILALVGSVVAISIAAFQIGLGTGAELAARAATADFDWSILSPVRDWVLVAEVTFWAGTVLGLWALVQGIVAMVMNRGRGAGIAAVAVAVVAPIAFAVALNVALSAGFAAGSGIGG